MGGSCAAVRSPGISVTCAAGCVTNPDIRLPKMSLAII